MKRLIYSRPDGGVSIVTPAKKSDIEKAMGPMTNKQYESLVYSTSIPKDAMGVRELEESEIPRGTLFRDAWEDAGSGKELNINLSKVRSIIRTWRNNRLNELDDEAMREGRKPNGDLARIDARAQELRDLTKDPRFNSDSLDDLTDLAKSIRN